MKRTIFAVAAFVATGVALAGLGPKANPQFLKWQKMKAAGLLPQQRQEQTVQVQPQAPDKLRKTASAPALASASSKGGFGGLGMIPESFSMNYIADLIQPVGLKDGTAIPKKYDLREHGYVTPVRDQGTFNTCWAFATLASLESAMLMQKTDDDVYTDATLDFSEKHLVDNGGFDVSAYEFGSMMMTAAYLTRWSGPVDESVSPYPAMSSTVWTKSSATGTPRVHVQGIRWVSPRVDSDDNETIKRTVMNHGAVFATMYWDREYYNSANNAYRSTGVFTLANPAAPRAINHGVTIVGWDDDFPRERFGKWALDNTFVGNGAFLVRNSWGSQFGDDGYFWVSYYDRTFAYNWMAVFDGYEDKSNYTTIYQYDELGFTGDCHAGETRKGPNKPWMANVFTAESDDQIKAVGFYVLAPNTKYSIRVYNKVTGDPKSGSLKDGNQQNGVAEYAGYYTVPLDKVVSVKAGEKFAVCVQLDWVLDAPLPMEARRAGYSSKVTAARGQSYYSPNGSHWKDLQDSKPGANFCVKAYGVGDGEIVDTRRPVSLNVTGPGVLAAGESGTYAVEVMFNDGSKESYWVCPSCSILSGEDAIGTPVVEDNTVTVTAKANVDEDTKVKLLLEVYDSMTDITVSREVEFMVTRSPPTAPTGFAASDGQTDIGVRLSWNEVANASGYKIFRSNTDDSSHALFVRDVEATRYTDLDAVSGSTYHYFVKAFNSSGTSGFSNGDSGWRALSIPENVQATDGDWEWVDVSWDSVEGANCYKVFRSTNVDENGNPDTNTVVAISDWIERSAFRDATAVKGVVYYYFVKSSLSVTGYRESDYSVFDQGFRKMPVTLTELRIAGPASVPAGMTAAYSLSATLSDGSCIERVESGLWKSPLSGDAFSSPMAEFSFEALVDGKLVASNTLIAVTARYTHTTVDGSTTLEAVRYIVIAPVIPAAPKAVKIDGSGLNGVAVSWDPVDGASSYNLYRGATAETAVLLSQNADCEFVDRQIAPGIEMHYWVEAVNAAGVSPKSGASAAVVRRFPCPSYVQATYDASVSDVSVVWNAVVGASRYRVSRADARDGEKHDLSGWIRGCQFSDTTAVPGETYWYFVEAAYDDRGTAGSDYSEPTIGMRSAAQTLAFIQISGPTTVQYDSAGSFVCHATYANGVHRQANPVWSFKSGHEGVSVSANGVVTAGHLEGEDFTLELQASYTDNGITKTDSFAVTFICCKPVVPSVFVSNLVVRARWPWNGKVDITYDLHSSPASTRAIVTVSGNDRDLGREMQAVSLSGDGVEYPAAGGSPHIGCHVVWDLARDYPDFHSSAFSVSLGAAPYVVAYPADFRASDGTSTNAVELAWEESFGARHYEIFRGLTANSADADLIASVTNATEFADVTAEAGETYHYWIRTVAGEFESDVSAFSPGVTGKRAVPPPDLRVNLQDGLVAYYPFDGNADNALGNVLHMSFVEGTAPRVVNGRDAAAREAYSFAGNTVLSATANEAERTVLEGDFTFAAWVKPSVEGALAQEQRAGFNAGCNFLLAPVNRSNGVSYGLAVTENGVNVFEGAEGASPAVVRFAANLEGWHLVVFTVEANGAPVLYVDGEYAKTGLSTGKTKRLFVGEGFGGGEFGKFSGAVDDACYYDRALTAGEVAALYEAGTPLSELKEVSGVPTITVTESDDSALVAIAAGEGESIYYSIVRIDGGDTVESRAYTIPFAVEGNATVIAWTVKADCYNSPRVRKEIRVAWSRDVEKALGGDDGIEWSASGDTGWFFDPSVASDGGDGSMRSGAVTSGGTSSMTARFSGAGVFAFDWKVSSESEFDVLSVTVDGRFAHAISGEQDWSELIIYIDEEGEHSVTWTYSKDGGVDRGQDCGWVDYVVWAPEGSMVETPVITATPIGEGASNTVTIASATPAALISYRIDADGIEGGWSEYSASVVPFVIEGDATIYARAKKLGFTDSFLAKNDLRRSWIVRIRHALVLGADDATRNGLDFHGDYYDYGTDEAYWWDEDRTSVSDGGFASARSAAVGNSEASSLYATVTGAGTLYFDRRVDSEAGWDVLTYYAGEEIDDYAYAEAVSGRREWERVKLVFRTDYLHLIEWEYDKDATGRYGADAGWIDNLRWVPARYAPAVPSPRAGHTFLGYSDVEEGEVRYAAGEMLDAEDETESFCEIWKTHEYTVRYDVELRDDAESNVQHFAYDVPQNLYSSDLFGFRGGYVFNGWQLDGDVSLLMDGQEVLNLTAIDGAELVLRPSLTAIDYTVQFYTEGVKYADDINATFDVAFALPDSFARDDMIFEGWTLQEGGAVEYAPGDIVSNLTANAGAVVNFYGVWRPEHPENALGEAIEQPALQMATGNSPWFVQDQVKYRNETALRSGAIGNDGISSLETVLSGDAKRISFYWKVSSENGFDYLRFHVDGVEQARICGEVGWTKYTVNVAAGTHTLKWSYTKDGSVSGGSDCGWLDYMVIREYSASSDDIWVDAAHGSDETGDGSRAKPFATIQCGVDEVNDGGRVHVLPGLYASFGSRNRSIAIVSTDGANRTVVDGSYGNAPGVTNTCANLGYDPVTQGSRADCCKTTLTGFTLQNGYIGTIGGTVRNCLIQDCFVGDDGGGALGSTLHNCVLTRNYARDDCGSTSGGACRSCTLYNCTVYNNRARRNGAGITYSVAYNSIIWHNFEDNGAEVNVGGWSSQIYNCMTGGTDPMFVDAANGDFRLRAGSPAIDAGNNLNVQTDTDLVGGARIINGTVDLGAFEYGTGSGEAILRPGAFMVTQYSTTRRPYTMADANSTIANPSYWSESPVSNAYRQICFSDNEDQTTVPFYSSKVSFPGNVGYKRTYYAVEATGYIVVPEAGEWTMCCGSDDGFSVEITGEDFNDSFQYYGDRNYGESVKVFNFPKAGIYRLRAAYFEYGDASTWILSVAKGRYAKVNTSYFKLLGTPESGITPCTPSVVPSWAE